jgi:hypothetical protein
MPATLACCLPLLALAPVEPAAAALQEPKATIGQIVPDHTFRAFLAGGDGRQKLSEFRGQPVLIVNWTDTDFGQGAAKEAEKLAKELAPEGLVTILLDTHNKPEQEIEASVMRLYPGSPARLTQNQKLPIEYLQNGPPPAVALVGVDGTLLVAGSYTVDLNKAAKLVKAELKKARSGWGEHAAARAARALAYGEGSLGAAKQALAAALQAEPAQAELLAVQAELAAHCEARVKAARWLLEHGEVLRSLDQARALAASVKGDADWEAQVGALLEELAGDEIARELELDRKLVALLQPLAKKAPDREPEKLHKFAAEAAGTRVGKRAQHLAEIAALAARK